ncbi:MAG TPA: stage II sporulation protein M [Burkholderiales bacterium]
MSAPLKSSLKSYEFRREREKTWHELEALVSRAEKRGLKALPADDLLRLPTLYRATLSSLSVARSISLDQNVLNYLESLSARAYFQVYGARSSLFEGIAHFLRRGFPAAVRAALWPNLIAALCMALGATIAFFLVQANADWYYTFAGGMAEGRTPAASTEFLRAGLYDGGDDPLESLYLFATFLFSHNASIGMFAFALGFALGIPTVLLMFYNGLLLGAMLSLYASRGLTWDLVGWLSVHGTTELLAIVLCGGGGLVLARAIVFPDSETRLESLARRGRAAGTLIMGAVLMLFVAGLLEGFARQLLTDITGRYLIGGLMLAFWLTYFTLGGRNQRQDRSEPHDDD